MTNCLKLICKGCFVFALLFMYTANAQQNSKPLEINLKDFVISIPGISIDKHYALSIKHRKNKAHVGLEYGDTPIDKVLNIKNCRVKIIKIALKFESDLFISDEGKPFSLKDWKHYKTDWEEIDKVKPHQFVVFNFEDGKHKNFYDIDENELKAAIKKYAGESWYKNYLSIPYSYVVLSKTYMKIEYIKNKKKHIKYIEFDLPVNA